MITETNVLTNLQGYSSKIQKCIQDAVQHFQEKLSDEAAIISQSTKASYIRDFIVENAQKYFYNDSNVTIGRKRGMIVFIFNTIPYIILKFKKFNKYNRVAYSRTSQALAFTCQEELFPAYENPVHLHAGYKWNETGTRIECLIGYPNGEGKHAWIAELTDRVSTPIIHTIEPNVEAPKVRVKIKPIEKTNEQNG